MLICKKKAWANVTGEDLDGVENPADIEFNCTTFKLSTSSDLNYFFGVVRLNETFLAPRTVYDVLKFKNSSQFYNGSYNIRGIPCFSYVSCQYSDDLNMNYTVTYYFSSKFSTKQNKNAIHS